MDEDSILIEALQIPQPEARRAFLDRVCEGQPGLRRSVEQLLAAHQEAGSFLIGKADGLSVTVDRSSLAAPLTERPGMQIGPYKLLQQIGEGGFGVVFMAEQQQPVRRKVALKIIKPGMDTREVIARFEAERQALALMDHPNIARVLDAGATESGRPYFVMELVKGVPITEYCDKNELPTRERLKLFTLVCQAVQHAHQKGVIHRDIKPSNILVTLHDGTPVPKVIDFGVSKAISQQLTEKTLFTAFGQMIGTPQYMSPEQAEMSGLDIDTRSDIFSLGVLLYELLTGTTPLDAKRLRAAGLAEMQRLIREEEPPKPSTRVSTMGMSLTAIAKQRKIDARKLRQELAGELDWIVMKALEKERGRRYETANGFAADVQRFLNDEPITACPPSAFYRFKKFARRNKAAITTVGIVATALVLATAVSTWQAFVAINARNQERQRAESEAKARRDADAATRQAIIDRERAVKAERKAAEDLRRAVAAEQQAAQDLARAIAAEKQMGIERDRAEANFAQARKAVNDSFIQISESKLLKVPGMQPLRQELLKSSLDFFEQFIRQREDDPSLQLELAQTYLRIGEIRQELEQKDEALQALERASGGFQKLIRRGSASAEARAGLAKCLAAAGKLPESAAEWETVVKSAPDNREYLKELGDIYNRIAVQLDIEKKRKEALEVHQKARDVRLLLLASDPDKPEYLATMGQTLNNVGANLSNQRGRMEESVRMYREGVGYTERAYERMPQDFQTGHGLVIQLSNVAFGERALGRQLEALAAFQRAAEVAKSVAARNPAIPSQQKQTMDAYRRLAEMHRALNQPSEAARAIRQAEQILDYLPKDTADDWYVLAQVKALCAAPAPVNAPEAIDAAEQKRFADEAMAALKTAVDKGFRDAKRLSTDRELAPIRSRPAFATLQIYVEQAQKLAEVEKKPVGEKAAEYGNIAEALGKLSANDPENAAILAALARSRYALGLAHLGLGDTQKAEAMLAEARAGQQKLVDQNPNSGEYVAALGSTWYAFGDLHWRQSKLTEALADWDRGFEILTRGCLALPMDKALPRMLATKEFELAEHYGRWGHATLAGRHWANSKAADRYLSGMWEARYAIVTAWTSDSKGYGEACQMLAEKFAAEEPLHVAWALALRPDCPVPPEKILAIAERIPDSSAGNIPSVNTRTRAKALFRAGKLAEARGGTGTPFIESIIEFRLGNKEAAHAALQRAESEYVSAYRTRVDQALNNALDAIQEPWWWDKLHLAIYRQEAWQTIEHKVPPDPWQTLLEACRWTQLGNVAEAEAAFQAASDAAGNDPTWWVTLAQVHERLGSRDQAVAAFSKAVESNPQQAETWISGGRFWAERGEQERADADFAVAARLASGELDKFRQAGWWIAGPYPPEIATPFPPEEFPDPSKPLPPPPAFEGQAASPPAIAWRSITSSPLGQVYLTTHFPGINDCTCYLLTYIVSPDEREVILNVGGDGPRRVWLNGKLVYESATPLRYSYALSGAMYRIKLSLNPGRNTLLVKASVIQGKGYFDALLGDNVLHRTIDRTERREFANALPRWRELLWQTNDGNVDTQAILCAAAAADYDTYRKERAQYLARYGAADNAYTAKIVVFVAGILDDPVLDASQWNQLTKTLRAKAVSMGKEAIALAELRAGNHQAALQALLDDAVDKFPPRWPVIALAYHALGKGEESRSWLKKAEDWRNSPAPDTYRDQLPPYYHSAIFTPLFETLFREAATKIAGSVPPCDKVQLIDPAKPPPATAAASGAAGDDSARANVWIARGRFFAQTGKQAEADADYAKAAALASQELNRFLEGGWWVIGPYPPGLEQFCPPEFDPDPSKPVPVVDDKGLLSDQPVPWRSVSSDSMGRVNVPAMPNAAEGSCYYALAHVYSPDERAATLWLGTPQSVRCWVNGELQPPPVEPHVWGIDSTGAMPLVLRKGRNRLLLKLVAGGPNMAFTARLGDHPADRALQLNRFGLLRESAEAFEAAHQRKNMPLYPRNVQALTWLTLGERDDYKRIAAELLMENSAGWPSFSAAVVRAHASTPIEEAERLVKTIAEVQLNRGDWRWREVALLEYRAGRWQAALDALANFGDDPGAHAWATAAMAHHQLGNAEKAREFLQKCHAFYQENILSKFWGAGVEYLAEFYPTYHEACQLIEGDTKEIDRQFAGFLEKRRKLWAAQDPLIKDFDDAVRNAQDPVPAFLARGERLAELKRWEAAEADFNKAVELKADSPEIRAERAFFYADWGKLDQAVADLTAAYQLFPESRPRPFEGQGIDWQLAGREELFARMTSADSQNNHYWVIRMIRMLQEGRLNDAKTASESLAKLGGFEGERAAAALAVGDTETFEKVCEQIVKNLDDTWGRRWGVNSLAMAPVSPTLAGTVLTAAERNYQDRNEGDNLAVAARGLAYFRNGKYPEAIADLEGAITAERGTWHRAPFFPALAMAYYRAGNPDAARSWLARSQLLLDLCEKLGPDRSGLIINPRSIPPGVWLQFFVLHREAKALIEGQPPAANSAPVAAEKPAAPAKP